MTATRHPLALAAAVLASLLDTRFAEAAPRRDYWRARAAAAIILTTETTTTRPRAGRRRTLYVYRSASPCPPCDRLAAELDTWPDPPFDVIYQTTPPAGIVLDGYPALHWNDRKGRGRKLEGFHTRAEILAIWNASDRQP